ncbi:MAG TPA: FKBP-type peptidyl-prolyl cis-trans isomerase [Longimicrobium sp.]|jgi:FKBP-type peptidyl-prolyl cis-trans isomerase FkpA
MRIRHLLALAALCTAAAACDDDLTGATCVERTSTVASTRGDTVTTASGLRYINLTAGDGDLAQSCNNVGIHYTLYVNGTAVDSLRETGYVFNFVPGEQPPVTIEGVAEGVLGMREGGTRRLIIPPALGYGARTVSNPNTGAVIIPPNSTLIFDVEVRQVL